MILGFDTATPDTVVAVTDTTEPIEVARPPRPDGRPAHGPALLAAVEEAVERAGGWPGIERIAVGLGPGSFTGVRIGVATARALAQSRRLPLVGVPTTSALLEGLDSGGRPKLAVIDARRGEVFAAPGGEAGPGEPRVCAPEDLAATLGPERLRGALAVGDGAIRFRREIEAQGAEVAAASAPAHRVSPRQICLLGEALEPGPAEQVTPMYLRRPDAKRWQP
jgi:tRNA threonylcarbamoyladenosine biosynthesis protein TsaB